MGPREPRSIEHLIRQRDIVKTRMDKPAACSAAAPI
jgi:hypothetical protein